MKHWEMSASKKQIGFIITNKGITWSIYNKKENGNILKIKDF